MAEKLIDYSKSDFIKWNLEREKHLQKIDMLQQKVYMLQDELEAMTEARDYWSLRAASLMKRD